MVMTQRTAPKISMIGAIAAALIVGVSAFVMPGLACPPEEASSGGGATAILARAPKAEKSKTTSQGSSARSPVPASQSSSGVTFFGEAPALEAMRANQSKQDFVVAPRAMTVWRSDDLASPGNSGMVAMSGPGPGTEPRTYRLPEGKLEALSSLMARQDVPIWVEPSDDHIVIHATAEQHAVFEGFVKMIHPEAPGTPRLANPFGRGQSRSAAAVAGLAATGRLNELRAAAQSLEKNKRDIEREAERLRTTAEQQRDNSANLRDMARQLNEQAAAARDNAARDALRSTSNSLRSRSTALRNEADSMTKRIESLEVRIRQLEDSLEEIERKVEEAGDSEQSGTPSTSDGAFTEIVIEAPAAPSPPSPAVAPSIVPPPAPAALPPAPPASPDAPAPMPPPALH